MNNKKAKKLRQILLPDNAVSKRVYRRAKKLYARLSEDGKKDFLAGLETMMGN
jgi:hypothetical protein